MSKKPTSKRFRAVIAKTGGNISKAAEVFQVERCTIHRWINTDPEFKQILEDERGKIFDKCFAMAQVVAYGIPAIDPDTGQIRGWIEKPDTYMLKYLLTTLGRNEGFAEVVNINTINYDRLTEAQLAQIANDMLALQDDKAAKAEEDED